MDHPPVVPRQSPRLARAVGRGPADEATLGSAIKLGAESVGRLLALVTTLLIARRLGVGGFGVFAAFAGIAVILAQVADLGLQTTATRALVTRTLPVGSMVGAKLALTAPMLLAGMALRALSPRFQLLNLLIVHFVLAGWSEFLGAVLRARGRRTHEAAVILLLRASGLVFVGVALRWDAGVTGLTWALALSPVPSLLLGAALVRSTYGAGGVEEVIGGGRRGVLVSLRTALPLGVNGSLATAGLRVELLALAFFRGALEAGLFAAALRVIEFLIMIPNSISAGAMPALTREGERRAGPVRERTAVASALLAAPAATGLVLLAPGLVRLLFGPEYAEATVPLRILAVALVAVFMNSVLLHSLIAVDRAAWVPVLTAPRVAVAGLLALVLVPRLGAVGGAIGFAVAEVLLLALASRASAAARFDVPVARPLGLGLCASAPMAAAVAWAGGGPLASGAIGIATYAMTLVIAWRLAPRFLRVAEDPCP